MVLELSTLCLRSICDGVETGQILGHHLAARLHPTSTCFRQRLLDMSLIRGSIDNPNCIAAFGSKAFLDGMTMLRTTVSAGGRDTIDEPNWLIGELYALWATTLSSVSQFDAEKTIGARIQRLQSWMPREIGLEQISDIVSKCPNLKSLELVVGRDYITDENANDSTRSFGQIVSFVSIVSQLETLAIDDRLSNDTSIGSILLDIRYSNLRSLRLRGCHINGRIWERFLNNVRSTLEHLDIGGLTLLPEAINQLIPFPMDRLQRLRIIDALFGEFRVSTQILAQCGSLAYLDVSNVHDEDFARALMELPIANLKVSVFILENSPHIPLNNHGLRRYQFIDDPFKDKITGLDIVTQNWNDNYNKSLTDFLAACPNLVRLRFRVQDSDLPPFDLGPLFDNHDQCGRFMEIYLASRVKFGRLFENCIDLDRLILRSNPYVRDQDLIAWTKLGGGRLSHLGIFDCPNVTRVGLIALSIASGSKLEKFDICYQGTIEDTEGMKRAVSQYCPYAVDQCFHW